MNEDYRSGMIRSKLEMIDKMWNNAEYVARQQKYIQDKLRLNDEPPISELLIA